MALARVQRAVRMDEVGSGPKMGARLWGLGSAGTSRMCRVGDQLLRPVVRTPLPPDTLGFNCGFPFQTDLCSLGVWVESACPLWPPAHLLGGGRGSECLWKEGGREGHESGQP